jgi:cell division protein FtsB
MSGFDRDYLKDPAYYVVHLCRMIQALRKNLNTIIYVSLILLAVWVSFIIVYGKGGIVKRKNLEAEILALEEEIVNLEKEGAVLDIAIHNLRHNRIYIEGYARELGYRKEGEIIYKFIERE